MSEYKLKTGKLGEKVVGAYKKVEDAFVGAYKKIEDAFVDRFLEKVEPEQEKSGENACPEEGAEDKANRAASDPRSSL